MGALIVILAAADLAAAAFYFVALPSIMQSSIATARIFVPDFVDGLTAQTWFALGWGTGRTVLLLAATVGRGPWVSRPRAAVVAGQPVPG